MSATPINPGTCRDGILSLGQEATLIRQELRQRNGLPQPTYTVPICFEVLSGMRVDAVRAAWSTLLRRHSVLRTTFVPSPRYPDALRTVQLVTFRRTSSFVPGLFEARVWDEPVLELRHQRVDARSPTDALCRVNQIARDMQHTPATGAHPSLTIVSAPCRTLIVGTLSHIISDAWSFRLLQREFVRLYGSLATGRESQLGRAADFELFARDEKAWALSGHATRYVDHWREQWEFAAMHDSDQVRLPFATAGEEPGGDVDILRLTIPESAARAVRTFTVRTSLTTHVVLRTAFSLALAHLAATRRVSCWTNFANRGAPGALRIVGPTATRYPLGFAVKDETFEAACRTVASQLTACERYAALPLTAFLARTGLKVTEALSSITFDSGWPSMPRAQPDGLVPIRAVRLTTGRDWIDLDVRVRYEGGCLQLTATFNGQRYERAVIAGLLTTTAAMVTLGVREPAANVRRLAASVLDSSRAELERRGTEHLTG